MVETYTVSMYENAAKNFQLHKMFIDLQAAELTCKQAIRASEVEVCAEPLPSLLSDNE